MTTQVFILGTGRSGTNAIAKWLSDIPHCRVVHEMRPVLLKEVVDYLQGEMTDTEMVELLVKTRRINQGHKYALEGESNQRLSFCVPALVNAFPQAKYIWLIRDGREVAASLHYRKCYHPREEDVRHPSVGEWARRRITGVMTHDMDQQEWDAYDAFEKCCWYWAYTNRILENQFSLNQAPMMSVKLEELNKRRLDILRFLEMEPDCIGKAPLPKRTNSSRGRRPLHWAHWPQSKRRSFVNICGPQMDRHYPEWRSGMRQTERVKNRLNSMLVRGVRTTTEAAAHSARLIQSWSGLAKN